MFGSRSREGHDFSDGLVETLVGSVPQEVGQVAVGHLVLVVTHLVVHREEVVHGDLGAHFDPEEIAGKLLLSAVTVLGTDMAQSYQIYCTNKKKAAQQHVSDESDGMSTGVQVQKNKLSPFPGTEGVDITQSDTRGVERVTF